MSERKILASEIHHRVIRKFPKRKVVVFQKDEIWAIDLAQMNAFESFNDGYKYILCVIDVFTKYAWCIALKTKTNDVVLNAIKTVIKDSGRQPEKIWVDRGSEFYNKNFKGWAKKNNITFYSTYGESKSVVVERFIRSLKELITPIFTEQNTRNWVALLPRVLKTYNNRFHRSIGMTPAEASDPENEVTVFTNLHKKNKKQKKKQKPKFQVGDEVRISRQKGIFEKGHEYNFSYEVFKITKVLDTDPITYHLADDFGDPIEGSFYEQELLKTAVPDYLEMDKVLKEEKRGKKKYYFVSFVGLPKKFNKWLSEDEFEEVEQASKQSFNEWRRNTLRTCYSIVTEERRGHTQATHTHTQHAN